MGRRVSATGNKSGKQVLRQSDGHMRETGLERYLYTCSCCRGEVNGTIAVPDGNMAMAHPRCLKRRDRKVAA